MAAYAALQYEEQKRAVVVLLGSEGVQGPLHTLILQESLDSSLSRLQLRQRQRVLLQQLIKHASAAVVLPGQA